MKTTIAQKDYYVYLLTDEFDTTLIDGVFYVGFGNAARLRSTITEARYDKPGTTPSRKVQKIREIWSQGREPGQQIVFSSRDEFEAREQESFYIKKYSVCITNHQGVHTKYPDFSQQKSVNLQDESQFPITLQDLLNGPISLTRLQAAINASREVTAFLEEIQQQIYPEEAKQSEADQALMDLVKSALKITDIPRFLGMDYMSLSDQNKWVGKLVRSIIALTKTVPNDKYFYDNIWEGLRADGFRRIDTEDVIVLILRLQRAGRIPKELGV